MDIGRWCGCSIQEAGERQIAVQQVTSRALNTMPSIIHQRQ